MIAGDRPEVVPMPPGRSGFEFIARLIELEHFASSQAVFSTDMCPCATERSPQPSVQCGTISKEHAFVPSDEFSAVHPYRSLKTDRLRLSGNGQWNMEERTFYGCPLLSLMCFFTTTALFGKAQTSTMKIVKKILPWQSFGTLAGSSLCSMNHTPVDWLLL